MAEASDAQPGLSSSAPAPTESATEDPAANAWANWRATQGWGNGWQYGRPWGAGQGLRRENAEAAHSAEDGSNTAGMPSASNGTMPNGNDLGQETNTNAGVYERGSPARGSWSNWNYWGSSGSWSYDRQSWDNGSWHHKPSNSSNGGGGDKDVPTFDGNTKKTTMQQYFRRIDIWEAITSTDPEKRGPKLLSKLEGVAEDKMATVSPSDLKGPDGVQRFKDIIWERFEPNENIRVGRVMDTFLFNFHRLPEEDFTDFDSRFSRELFEVEKIAGALTPRWRHTSISRS